MSMSIVYNPEILFKFQTLLLWIAILARIYETNFSFSVISAVPEKFNFSYWQIFILGGRLGTRL